MESITLLFTALIAAVLVLLESQRKRSKLPNGSIPLPGPRPLPIIGNLHQMSGLSYQGFVDKWTKDYGPIFQLQHGAKTWIVLNDYEIIRDLLVKRGAIYSSRPYTEVTRIYFDGGKTVGFAPYGKYWRAMRTIAHQALTRKMIDNNYYNTIHTEIKDLTMKFYNRGSQGFDPVNDMVSTFIDLLATISYGQKSEKLSQNIKQMIFDFGQILNVRNSLVDIFPWLSYIPFLADRMSSYAYKAKGLVREMSTQLLKDLRQRLQESDEEENSFAAHMLKTMNISSTVVTKPYEDSLEEDDDDSKKNFVFDEIDFMSLNNSFLVTGISTTVPSLRWIWAVLVNYPKVQRKIQKELDECLQGNRFPSPQDDSKLPYLHATIKECFRYRPEGFLLHHSTTKDDIYRGYHIPAKSVILINYKTAHTSEKLFERPNEFYPEHYLDENGQLKKYDELRDPWSFGKGRRACVGQHLAERNLIAAVGYVLTLFDIENDIDPITGNPIKLNLKMFDDDDDDDDEEQPYKLRFVPRPGVTLEKIMQMNYS